jgi:NarL family two-component system response regulator YdfI
MSGGVVTRVLVVCASAVVRAGLEALVKESPTLVLSGSLHRLSLLAQQIEELLPDLVLLDLNSFDEDKEPLPIVDTFSDDLAAIPILVLADELKDTRSFQALRDRVRAVLPRNSSAVEIKAAIEAAAAGLIVFHPETVDSFFSPAPPGSHVQAGPLFQTLTQREIEVLRMLAEGLGNKIIADRLRISEHTVKFHIASIFNKLDVSSRTEAVTVGIRAGLIPL